jgi:hypothetical protein
MRQSAKRAVRGGMAIAAYKRAAGLRELKFRTDDMHNSLLRAAQIVQRHCKFSTIGRERCDLLRSHFIETFKGAACGREVPEMLTKRNIKKFKRLMRFRFVKE